MKVKIYCNYGVLAAEKRNVYTYGAPAGTATCWDEIEVNIPDELVSGETPSGDLLLNFPDGLGDYTVNEVLGGNKTPELRYINKDFSLKIIKLK